MANKNGLKQFEENIQDEALFSADLLRFIQYFNLLEENIGLCIAHLENPRNPKISYPFLARSTVEMKMERLKNLFVQHKVINDKACISEFNQWFKSATKTRTIRNRYVHGRWEYLPLRSDKPIGCRVPIWMVEKQGIDAEEILSAKEFSAIVDEAETIFNTFMKIRKKHSV